MQQWTCCDFTNRAGKNVLMIGIGASSAQAREVEKDIEKIC